MSTKAYAAQSATAPLAPFSVTRRDPLPTDVAIDILYCGVCHSDLHQVRNEWHDAPTVYPCVPGHEIVGRVTKVGRDVKKFKEGDLAAVGCMVDSCRTCPSCTRGLEQYCEHYATLTYNSPDKHSGGVTYGGYSERIVVDEAFVLQVSDKLEPRGDGAAACAGITTYSPLRHWKVGPGPEGRHRRARRARPHGGEVRPRLRRARRAVHHLAGKIGGRQATGRARGRRLEERRARWRSTRASFDFILDAVSAQHDINAYLQLLKLDGTLCLVGAPEKPLPVPAFNLLMPRRQLRRLGHRRHRRDAGDARLLRRARHRQRHRDDPASRRSTRPTSGCSRAT